MSLPFLKSFHPASHDMSYREFCPKNRCSSESLRTTAIFIHKIDVWQGWFSIMNNYSTQLRRIRPKELVARATDTQRLKEITKLETVSIYTHSSLMCSCT